MGEALEGIEVWIFALFAVGLVVLSFIVAGAAAVTARRWLPLPSAVRIGVLAGAWSLAVGLTYGAANTGYASHWFFGIICWVGAALYSIKIFQMSRSSTPQPRTGIHAGEAEQASAPDPARDNGSGSS
jgi:hypothetical protein